MKMRHLQTRFILAGVALVMTTILSGLWSAWTFARLTAAAGKTLQVSQRTIDLTAVLSDALERQDDALLLAVSGNRGQAKGKLEAERQRFAQSYSSLLQTLDQPQERRAALALQQHANEYGAAGDVLLSMAGDRDAMAVYYQRVNPALRKAVADCASIRESNFQSMQLAATIARDEARRATIMVAAISAVALLISALVAVALARSVLLPIQELGSSVEALRAGDFERRARVSGSDELGALASGFNRMAEALAEFRRVNLGEVLRAKETLESTLRALPDAVLVIDPDGCIVASNPLARSVLKATGVENAQQIADLPLPSPSLGAVDAALRGERGNETRAEFSRALSVWLDGRRSKFMFTVIPIPEFREGRFGAVAILYDVTDFARLDELRTELIGVASHELKTPLTTLRMNLMLLAEKADNLTARQHEILDTAMLGCQQLADTIDELLDLTRIEAGQLRLAQETVDVRAVIERAAATLRQRYEDAAVRLLVPKAEERFLVRGDPARLSMVFTNLLSNALKYTPGGGAVSIAIVAQGKAANGHVGLGRITVTDTGPGIPHEFRERVFDKFFRVEPHLETTQGGTWGSGIGLYLCRQIVEAHGGKISCEAGDHGIGTRIVVDLPGAIPPVGRFLSAGDA
jgi:NtrC-family two-component system sensor histidine kinase KinB